eukprot:Pgem_evm1s5124
MEDISNENRVNVNGNNSRSSSHHNSVADISLSNNNNNNNNNGDNSNDNNSNNTITIATATNEVVNDHSEKKVNITGNNSEKVQGKDNINQGNVDLQKTKTRGSLSDFDTIQNMDPFENAELKAINEMDILNQVFHSNSGKDSIPTNVTATTTTTSTTTSTSTSTTITAADSTTKTTDIVMVSNTKALPHSQIIHRNVADNNCDMVVIGTNDNYTS